MIFKRTTESQRYLNPRTGKVKQLWTSPCLKKGTQYESQILDTLPSPLGCAFFFFFLALQSGLAVNSTERMDRSAAQLAQTYMTTSWRFHLNTFYRGRLVTSKMQAYMVLPRLHRKFVAELATDPNL